MVDLGLLWIFILIIISVIMFYVYFRIIYDLVLCFKIHIGYINNLFKIEFGYKIDYVGVIGLLRGLGVILLI